MLRRLLVASTVLAVSTASVLLAAPAVAAPKLPAGFSLVSYDSGQDDYNLTNFTWLPDGSLLTIGKDGTVTFVPDGGKARKIGKVPGVRAVDDHGLLGLALARDHATSGKVYLSYDKGKVGGTGHGMLEEWQALPAASPTTFTKSRTVVDGSDLSEDITETGTTHGPDSVVVAKDGSLFWSIGDNAGNNGDPKALRAQDLDDPHGKILHVTPEGEGVSSNPFYDDDKPRSVKSLVYAYGFRNPFRFSIDARSGLLNVGDVGWRNVEEVSMVGSGANAGWPCMEGAKRTSFGTYGTCKALYKKGDDVRPIWTYNHAGRGASITGGALYTGSAYPAQYKNSYFLGDYTRNLVWSMAVDANGKMTRKPEGAGFIKGAGGPVAFHPGPNGDMTYADILSGKIQRIVYGSGNRKPTADIAFTTDADRRTVSFSAGGSYDPDGDKLTYRWEFGDGSTGTGETPKHTYTGTGAQQVKVTATDQIGATDSAEVTVYPANHSPALSVTLPAAGKLFKVGEPVKLSASATDVEDGRLEVSYETILLHCPFPNSCHLHPDGTEKGGTYSKEFTDHGSDTSMQITVSAKDSRGAEVSKVYLAKPNLRTVTVKSKVPVNIDGATTFSSLEVEGQEVQLDAPETSGYHRFTGWSDGGKANHTFVMPNRDVVLTAGYETFIDQKYAALGGKASFLGKAKAGEYSTTGGRSRTFKGGRIIWSEDTGAHEVHGLILKKFLKGGGIAKHGFPTGDEVDVKGGQVSVFTDARIYHITKGKTSTSRGPILAKYLSVGGPDDYGLPATDVKKIKGGEFEGFTDGRSIYWSKATGAHLVYGLIRQQYKKVGYEKSCLGLPTKDEYGVEGGRRADFVGGYIRYDSASGKTSVHC
ncbi:PQQ-dependent sugar dehydrogenase [Microlunatus spumicola]|uniref:PQQ-dependent sugar dehydrogenase n=1 Tax=Microlunatus spumicola TaxID=81499 RepID=A0ABP6XPK1_9ACTN